jgi:hypothetical protein
MHVGGPGASKSLCCAICAVLGRWRTALVGLRSGRLKVVLSRRESRPDASLAAAAAGGPICSRGALPASVAAASLRRRSVGSPRRRLGVVCRYALPPDSPGSGGRMVAVRSVTGRKVYYLQPCATSSIYKLAPVFGAAPPGADPPDECWRGFVRWGRAPEKSAGRKRCAARGRFDGNARWRGGEGRECGHSPRRTLHISALTAPDPAQACFAALLQSSSLISCVACLPKAPRHGRRRAYFEADFT